MSDQARVKEKEEIADVSLSILQEYKLPAFPGPAPTANFSISVGRSSGGCVYTVCALEQPSSWREKQRSPRQQPSVDGDAAVPRVLAGRWSVVGVPKRKWTVEDLEAIDTWSKRSSLSHLPPTSWKCCGVT